MYSYPVKGLGGMQLATAQVGRGGLRAAHDRRFGIAFADSQALLSGKTPWRPWEVFVSLKKYALAAHLSAEVSGEDDAPTLTLRHRDGREVSGKPHDAQQRQHLQEFLQDALQCAPLTLVDSRAQPLWDDAEALTLVNQASLGALAQDSGEPMQVERFRPNILLDGAAPWAEATWHGSAQLGACRLRFGGGVPRCAATTVHPVSAERDCRPPQFLARLRGSTDFGIFAQVEAGGTLHPGAELHLEPSA